MWLELNRRLKRRLPWLHRGLKVCTEGWRAAPVPFMSVPSRIRGEFFWIHPRLLTADARDTEPHICRWVLEHLPSGGTFFDVGAHYGWLSLKAARHVGGGGSVVAFEASPVLIDILSFHARRNRLPQITIVESAVSESDQPQADFYLLNGGLSSRNSLTIGRRGLPLLDSEPPAPVQVPALKLDTFCETHARIPDVIKIDVEGAEGMVLRGAMEVLRRYRPVLVFSTHPYWFPTSESTQAIFDQLASAGYRLRDAHVVQFRGYEVGDYLCTC